MEIRIIIADRQTMFREALRKLLEAQPDFCVVAETGDGEEIAKLVAAHKPDVLLMDLRLNKRSGLEALREAADAVKTIILTDSFEPGEMMQALLWGARGLVRKDTISKMLFKSIRTVTQGQFWVSRDAVVDIVDNLRSLSTLAQESAQAQTRRLSLQQQQIIEAIVEGYSNREIAKELKVSERTVKYHLTRIFEKLGVSGRMELARFSIRNTPIGPE